MSDVEMAAHLQVNDSLAHVVSSSPQHDEQQQQISPEITVAQISPEAVDEIIRRYKSFPKSESDTLDELRGWLMVLATLTASITWTAALNPPGGVWQADDAAHGYKAGGSVFRDKNPITYLLFSSFNFVGFYSSLLILVLLSVTWLFRRTYFMVFSILVSADLVSLFASFIFGRSVTVKYSPVFIGLMIGYISISFVFLASLIRRPRN